jgi:phosphoglycolate phosphatase
MGRNKYHGRRARAFIFDLDGTLVDSAKDIAISANFARLHFGLPEIPEATTVSYIGDGVEILMQRMLGHDYRQTSPEEIAEGLGVLREHYGNHCLDNTVAYPGVLAALAHFHRIPMMVATNKPSIFAAKILDSLNLTPAFRTIVAGDNVTRKKPDPEMLQKCLKGLDVNPADVVMVGDSPNDVNAAKSIGAISVGCTYGIVAAGILKSANPDITIDSFDELKTLFPSRDTLE